MASTLAFAAQPLVRKSSKESPFPGYTSILKTTFVDFIEYHATGEVYV